MDDMQHLPKVLWCVSHHDNISEAEVGKILSVNINPMILAVDLVEDGVLETRYGQPW